MGCCASNNSDNLSKKYFCQRLKDAIDSCNTQKIFVLLKSNEGINATTQDMDQELVTINNKSLNALAYCVHSGNNKMFNYLISLGCSVSSMEALLFSQGMRAINMICFKNFIDLLQVYLPIYLQSPNSEPSKFEYPIHSACKSGSLSVIKYIQGYFSHKCIPAEFNVESVNENDENGILVACRYGQLNTVKYLNEICRMSLNVLNRKGENALLVCLNGYKQTPSLEYFDLVVYLVEEIGIDVRYMYAENMKVVDNKEIADYLEEKLEKFGIFCRKNEHFDLVMTEISSDWSEVNLSREDVPFDEFKRKGTNSFIKFERKRTSNMSIIREEVSEIN